LYSFSLRKGAHLEEIFIKLLLPKNCVRQYLLNVGFNTTLKGIAPLLPNGFYELFLFRFNDLLSQASEHAAEMSKVLATNRQRTLNATLKLYAGYTDEEHDMLQKRVFKQLELDNAKKNFEKAKPQKKQQVDWNIWLYYL